MCNPNCTEESDPQMLRYLFFTTSKKNNTHAANPDFETHPFPPTKENKDKDKHNPTIPSS